MRLSKLVLETLKQTSSDIKIVSHALMVRAGFMKQVANGIYTLGMPAQKMALNIEAIIRDEMNKVDGQEVKFPVVMPRELWDMSGRYSSIGAEMIRFKDRTGHDMVLGMTHEEAAVHFAMNTISSYSRLPFMIYQIQTKFRDEARSRGGLIRVREFTMKDAYSFHNNEADLETYYYRQHQAYENIFKRIGLKNFISVKSDSGMMGGSIAHEFMLLTNDGEDELVICPNCDYKSNMEVAEAAAEVFDDKNDKPAEKVFTGEAKTIDEVSNYLKTSKKRIMKAVVYAVRGETAPLIVFLRGDLEVNEAKLKNYLGALVFPYETREGDGIAAGNIGAIGLDKSIKVIFDKSLEGRKGMVTGSNEAEYHTVNVDVARDIAPASFADISKVIKGQKCKHCGAELTVENGIEIGNIFQLGTKYTKSMGMTVLNEKGDEINPIMGCYGIGVGRAIASVIQEGNDDKGMILPVSVAPWKVHICALRIDDKTVEKKAFKLYDKLTAAGIDTLIDDRNLSPGVKFADADLLGMPIRIIVSPKGLEKGEYEIKLRNSGEVIIVAEKDVKKTVQSLIKRLYAEIG